MPDDGLHAEVHETAGMKQRRAVAGLLKVRASEAHGHVADTSGAMSKAGYLEHSVANRPLMLSG